MQGTRPGPGVPERGHTWSPSESSPSCYYLQTSGKVLSPGLTGVTWGPRDRELRGEMWPAPEPGRKQRRGSHQQRQSRDPTGPAAQTRSVRKGAGGGAIGPGWMTMGSDTLRTRPQGKRVLVYSLPVVLPVATRESDGLEIGTLYARWGEIRVS